MDFHKLNKCNLCLDHKVKHFLGHQKPNMISDTM